MDETTTTMTVDEQVKSILLSLLDVDEALVTPTANIREDLGATSIDFVEFMTALEVDFDVSIPDDDVQELTTLQSAVDYIKAKTS